MSVRAIDFIFKSKRFYGKNQLMEWSMMLHRISISLMLACSSVAYAAAPGRIDLQAATNSTVYSDELGGFAANKNGAISLLAGQSPKSDTRSATGTYLYDSAAGRSFINVIDGQSRTPGSTQTSQRGPFAAQAAYGQLMWLPPYSSVPAGWGAVSGTYGSSILVKYLIGAPYGATESLNASFGIPLNWVRISPNPGGGYATFLYVLGAPFAAEIIADSTFPIPANWVRVAGSAGYGTFRNTAGAPSGTQWYVDVTWGVPAGWTYVGQTYPYRWARKN
jgi:hypothetical protein